MAVKIILREHVEHLGERGDVVSVAPGYARNYLFPKRLALAATSGNLKVIEQQRRVWEARELHEVTEAEKLAARLGDVELTVTKKAGQGGTLYGSVTKPEIVELLAARDIAVDRKQIGPDEPIKSVGVFEIPVKLHRKVVARIKLEVLAEDGTAD
jgi:large subunit ribosomal protein L9